MELASLPGGRAGRGTGDGARGRRPAVGRVPERSITVLQTAAVVGRQFPLAAVAAAVDRDRDATADDLETACAAGLLLETGAEEYAFVHALSRDAVLASLSTNRLARLHARVAHVLERDDRRAGAGAAAAAGLRAGPPLAGGRAQPTATVPGPPRGMRPCRRDP